MPSPPRTVFDGLEGIWENAEAGWRKANRLRDQVEDAKSRIERRLTQVVSQGVQQAGNGVKAGVDKVLARAGQTRPGKVVDALFGTTKSPGGPQLGQVDHAEVRRRQAMTAADVGKALSMVGPGASVGDAWPAAGVTWLNRVRPKGIWDDKAQHPRPEWPNYERQGNFAYGATAAELGLSEEAALRGAGLAQRLGNVVRVLEGKDLAFSEGWLNPPYGDDSRDQGSISDGYRYGVANPAGRRP